jgi:hypothetical protein
MKQGSDETLWWKKNRAQKSPRLSLEKIPLSRRFAVIVTPKLVKIWKKITKNLNLFRYTSKFRQERHRIQKLKLVVLTYLSDVKSFFQHPGLGKSWKTIFLINRTMPEIFKNLKSTFCEKNLNDKFNFQPNGRVFRFSSKRYLQTMSACSVVFAVLHIIQSNSKGQLMS